MKNFNPDKELNKIQKHNKNKILYGIIVLLIIISISSTYALYQVRHSKRIIYTTVSDFKNNKDIILAVHLDNNTSDKFPEKGEGYYYDHIECDIDSEGYTIANWDSYNWLLDIKTKGPNKCNVYFKTIEENDTIEYTYNGTDGSDGTIQTFVAPIAGKYKLEVWGAQGGSTPYATGGYGGYAEGEITLSAGTKLYILVGGRGSDGSMISSTYAGGYNGGGIAWTSSGTLWGAGGGATHIAKAPGLLSILDKKPEEILIVAGGGGGAGSSARAGATTNTGGSAGGYNGSDGSGASPGHGGTQTEGGIGNNAIGSFGRGAEGYSGTKGGAGGGGGYYGGGDGYTSCSSAGGGSSYISPELVNAAMYCYNCEPSPDALTKTISNNNVEEIPISMYSKKGNGYARITLISKTN